MPGHRGVPGSFGTVTGSAFDCELDPAAELIRDVAEAKEAQPASGVDLVDLGDLGAFVRGLL